jgi:hypothetical protein
VATDPLSALRRNPEALKDWFAAHPAEAQVLVENYHRTRVEVARRDVNEFIEFVGRHEDKPAEPIRQAHVHEEFQRLANEHRRLVIWSHIESGKTSQLSILRPLWLLGRNPNLRIAVVSNTAAQAKKILSAQQKYINESEALREVFPELTPGAKWSDQAYTVKRTTHAKDYSVQGLGVHGAILGARLDVLILDDILDYENTRTPAQRQELWQWVTSTLFGRLTRNAVVIVVGTAWHPEDILHRLGKMPGWHNARFPILDEDTGDPRWPEAWPKDRVEEKARDLGPLEAARQLFCRARDDGESRFKREWVDKCLARGEGRELPFMLQALPGGYRTFTGVDLGTRANKKSDLTVLFTICVHPNEDREVLEVVSGNWEAPEIVRRIEDVHKRFQSIVLVESNAAQDFIRQFLVAGSAIPVLPFTTGANKHHPEFGVESIAVELSNAKWIIPNRGGVTSRDIDAWIAEMLYYAPDAHTGDRLMAAWFAREGSKQKVKKVQVGRVDLHRR